MKVSVVNEGEDYRSRTDSGMALDIVYGDDKPAEDTTMNPLEIFLSALGMCIAVMLRKYCDAHDLDAEEIMVEVSGDFEPGDEVCENIVATVEIPGEWDERRKSAFHKVAETCPVHNTITDCRHMDIRVV